MCDSLSRGGILNLNSFVREEILMTHHATLSSLLSRVFFSFLLTWPKWNAAFLGRIKMLLSSILSCAPVWWCPPVLICCLKSRCLVRYYVGGWSRCGGCVVLYMFSRNGSSLYVCEWEVYSFTILPSSSLIITSTGPPGLQESPCLEWNKHVLKHTRILTHIDILKYFEELEQGKTWLLDYWAQNM